MEPFQISIPDSALFDLKRRLESTRLLTAAAEEPWASGVDYHVLSRLLEYWAESFDWRLQERRLNSFQQYRTRIEGTGIHFIIEGSSGDAVPVILSHGWPYSYIEMLSLIPYLTDPEAHGLDGPAFCVVVPSLPGYGFSEPLSNKPFTSDNVARLWHQLMTNKLGYERYLTYGEDVGCGISDWLGVLYPDTVAGIFATHAAFPAPERRQDLSEEETRFEEVLDEKWRTGRGYSQIQSTRPDTMAVALNDSPAGLLAWVLEKLHEWSGPGFDNDWTADDILTTVSLYWFTSTIGTSFLPYYHSRFEPALPKISVPVGVSVQWGERGFPRSYAERTYMDIRSWKELPRGGHFTAKQTPELVAGDLLAFARSLRLIQS